MGEISGWWIPAFGALAFLLAAVAHGLGRLEGKAEIHAEVEDCGLVVVEADEYERLLDLDQGAMAPLIMRATDRMRNLRQCSCGSEKWRMHHIEFGATELGDALVIAVGQCGACNAYLSNKMDIWHGAALAALLHLEDAMMFRDAALLSSEGDVYVPPWLTEE